MTFAHPAFLFGCLAALIPLLVHLLDRRRPRTQPFGAIAFVLRSQKRTARRLKLKRLILYTLRTLLLLALPLALARPQFAPSSTTVGSGGSGPRATVVVLDATLSMQFAPRGEDSFFEKAKGEAKDAFAQLAPEEPSALLVCNGAPESAGAPNFERSRQVSRIDDVVPSFASMDLNRCLELAARSLEESPLPGKRIVLVSDFTVNALRLEASAPVLKGPKGEPTRPEVVLRDVGAKAESTSNRAIVGMRAEPATQVGPRAWAFTFTVKNFSTAAASDVELQLRVDGQSVAKGFVELAANGVATKTLTWRFEQGGLHKVEGVLAADGLAADDAYSRWVRVPKELRALVVNGAPHPQKARDEAFFTEAALASGTSPVRAVVRDTEAAWKEKLSDYDVVMLLNVAAPDATAARALREFVENGGGLLMSMGDAVDPDAWNLTMGPLLPRRMRVIKTAVEPTAADAASRAARLNQAATTHSVLQPFTGRAREGLYSSRFYRYALLEAEADKGLSPGEVLASLDDGAPVLAAARRGKGRVLWFAASFDRDWTDFPLRTSFLPFVQRAALWLAGALEEHEELRSVVGANVSLKPEGERVPVEARLDEKTKVAVTRLPDGSFTVGPMERAGAWSVVDAENKPVEPLAFAVSLDSAESDLTRHSPEAVARWFGEETVRDASGHSAEQQRIPPWTWLILVAALAFIAEGVLLKS